MIKTFIPWLDTEKKTHKNIPHYFMDLFLFLLSASGIWQLFNFTGYFAYRDIMPTLSNYSRTDNNNLLEIFNNYFVNLGLQSWEFYTLLFRFLFIFGLIINFYVIKNLVSLSHSFISLNSPNTKKSNEANKIKSNFIKVFIFDNLLFLFFSGLLIFNPLSLYYLLIGNINALIIYFILPSFFYLLLKWSGDMHSLLIFHESREKLKNFQENLRQRLKLPVFIQSLKSTFLLSVYLTGFCLLNPNFQLNIFLLIITVFVLICILLIDLRKEYFKKPSIYIEEIKYYFILPTNVILKYIIFPLIVFLPSSLIVILVTWFNNSNDLYNLLPKWWSSLYLTQNAQSYNNDKILFQWFNLNYINSIPEISTLLSKLGVLQNYTLISNNYIVTGLILGISLFLIFWILQIFTNHNGATYLNIILLLLFLLPFSLEILRLFNIEDLEKIPYLVIFTKNYFPSLTYVILILGVLLLSTTLCQNFSKKKFLYPLTCIIFVIFTSITITSPFFTLSQSINYIELNDVYNKISNLCLEKGSNIILLPTNKYVSHNYYKRDFQSPYVTNTTSKIPIQNPLLRLNNCRLLQTKKIESVISFVQNSTITDETIDSFLKEIRENNDASVLIIDQYDNVGYKQLNDMIIKKIPVLINEGDIFIYSLK
jgi:hypothetical protein